MNDQRMSSTPPSTIAPGIDGESMLLALVHQHGLSEGARKMLLLEESASQWSLSTGIYGSFRNLSTNTDCFRVGPESTCLCGHIGSMHALDNLRRPSCSKCACDKFKWIPTRPEMVGEWWLPRRKEFKIHEYSVKCKCGHTPQQHSPIRSLSCRCCTRCVSFSSHFLCLVCNRHWEDHETVFETERERRAAGHTYGASYVTLAGTHPGFRDEFLAHSSRAGPSNRKREVPIVKSRVPMPVAGPSRRAIAPISKCMHCEYVFRSESETFCPVCAHWR